MTQGKAPRERPAPMPAANRPTRHAIRRSRHGYNPGITQKPERYEITTRPELFPANCLFNKKQTGCGATELAIRNNIPTIIAMPYVALVKNKTIYRKDDISVQGVYEGIQEQDIIDYAQNHSPLKIAVTYDSVPRTIKALQSIGIDPYKDTFLLVDE